MGQAQLCSKSETQAQQKKAARRWLMDLYTPKKGARSAKNPERHKKEDSSIRDSH